VKILKNPRFFVFFRIAAFWALLPLIYRCPQKGHFLHIFALFLVFSKKFFINLFIFSFLITFLFIFYVFNIFLFHFTKFLINLTFLLFLDFFYRLSFFYCYEFLFSFYQFCIFLSLIYTFFKFL
jgi:hypothetical protein